jgi:choline dehydrogenase-like flavoprotein
MEIDLESGSPPSEPFRAGVCIIGAGIAGLILARALAEQRIDVHLLEAGGHTLEDRSQAIYEAQSSARQYLGATEGRFRVFGGSSTRWGGQLLPYPSNIFTPPSGVPSPGWPISAAAVEPFYHQVQRILGVDDLPFSGRDFYPALKLPTPELIRESPQLDVRFSKWAAFSRRNLAQTVGKEVLAHPRITTWTHCNVQELLLAPEGGAIVAVIARNYAGVRFRFEAQQFVLATGTIESSRLLLASRSVLAAGVGNGRDQVGRRFHDHISVPVANLLGEARSQMIADFAPFLLPGTTHTAKFEASVGLREQMDLLAVMAHMVIQEPPDSGPGVVRALLTAVQHRDLRSALTRVLPKLPGASVDIVRLALAARLKQRRAVTDRALVQLRIDSEQRPRPENRVELHPSETDALGMPRTVINWSISPEEIGGIHRFALYLRDHFVRIGFPAIDWLPEALDLEADLPAIADTYHPMGGTPMGTDPSTSVVDTELKVHGVRNLSVASASTFPAGGSSNPTFTLMALTLRLARHLAERIDC